jgi:hypothetical protein
MEQTHLSGQQRDFWLALLIVLAMVLAPFSFAPGHASAAGINYYVNSSSGNDGSSGTSSSSPWRSLGPVNNRTFGPGDVINLARGSSWTGGGGNSATLTIRGGGASGSPITVQAYGSGSNPTIINNGSNFSRGIVIQAPWTVVQNLTVRDVHETGIYAGVGIDHLVIRSNEIVNTGFGIRVDSQYNLITGNNIHDLKMIVNTQGGDDDYGAQAVLLEGPNNEVSYNRMTNCNVPSYDYGMDGNAVEFFGNVDNSSVHHNYSYNVTAFNEVGSGGGGSARNVLIADNLIIQSGQIEVIHIDGTYGSTVSNFRLVNNTIVDTSNVGAYSAFYMSATPSDPNIFLVRNNIFYIRNYRFIMQNSVPFAHDHNIYTLLDGSTQLGFNLSSGERLVDAGFVNVNSGDFHLKAGSAAIDTGLNPAPYGTDYEGKAVPSGNNIDMGAFEYGGSAPPPGPTPTPPPPPPPPPPPSAEMLQNGSFESSTDPWILKLNSSGNASVALDGSTRAVGSNSVRLSNIAGVDANNVHNIQFRQDNVNLSGGKKYELVFWAQSDANRTLQAVVQKQDSPYTLDGEATVNLTTTWQRFSYTFTPGQADTVFAGFNLAGSGATVWIDGVSMHPAPNAALTRHVYLPVIEQKHN